MELNLSEIKKVYLCGIGGIGLSALAYYFLELGKEVAGSDISPSEVTRRLQAKNVGINFEQKSSNISPDIDLFLFTAALPDEHPELMQAKEYGIECISYFDFIGQLSRQYKTIAVAGTNGKTTTTAMIGLIMEKAGLDPTVIVGSLVPQWQSNFRLGKSDWLVVEACEWKAHMLKIRPQIIVMTNVAEDHLDYYKDLEDIKDHFGKFVDNLPLDGLLIKNHDDKNSAALNFDNQISYGQGGGDYRFLGEEVKEARQAFSVYRSDELIGKMDLRIPGKYNIYNSMASIALANFLKVNQHQIWNTLHDFHGTWRRFEILGQYRSNIVISDYAHHPDAIQAVLQAARDFYPDKNIIAIFQPHQQNRTQRLIDDFARSFGSADEVIITEIYNVAGREREAQQISAQLLADKISNVSAKFAPDFKTVKKHLRELDPSDSVLMFIGAGDIDNLARELV